MTTYTHTMFIDSSERNSGNTGKYEIRFDHRMKDVVGLQVSYASVPRPTRNIVEGHNIFNVHRTIGTPTLVTFEYFESVLDFFTLLNDKISVRLTSESVDEPTSQYDNRMGRYTLNPVAISTEYVNISSLDGNIVLWGHGTPPLVFPVHLCETHSPEEGVDVFTVLIPPSGFKVKMSDLSNSEMSLAACYDHKLIAKTGMHNTQSAMFEQILLGVCTNLDELSEFSQRAHSPTEKGWYVQQETTDWRLTFQASMPNFYVFFSREATEFDFLRQIGLRNAEDDVSKESRLLTRMVRIMNRYHDGSSSTSNKIQAVDDVSDQITCHYLTFNPVNLYPMRYVDIFLKQVPNKTITRNGKGGPLCRINMVSDNETRLSENQTAFVHEIQEIHISNVYKMYASYKACDSHASIFLQEIQLHKLNFSLIDNLGRIYECDNDHHIELKIHQLINKGLSPPATVDMSAPEEPPPEELVQMEQPPNIMPFQAWTWDHKLNITACILTFATTYFVANKLRSLMEKKPD